MPRSWPSDDRGGHRYCPARAPGVCGRYGAEADSGETALADVLGTTPRESRSAGYASGDRPNLTEQVYEQFIDLLIRGELRPGDVITERRMAERLNASRTPIREALGRLEAEGLVYKQPS